MNKRQPENSNIPPVDDATEAADQVKTPEAVVDVPESMEAIARDIDRTLRTVKQETGAQVRAGTETAAKIEATAVSRGEPLTGEESTVNTQLESQTRQEGQAEATEVQKIEAQIRKLEAQAKGASSRKQDQIHQEISRLDQQRNELMTPGTKPAPEAPPVAEKPAQEEPVLLTPEMRKKPQAEQSPEKAAELAAAELLKKEGFVDVAPAEILKNLSKREAKALQESLLSGNDAKVKELLEKQIDKIAAGSEDKERLAEVKEQTVAALQETLKQTLEKQVAAKIMESLSAGEKASVFAGPVVKKVFLSVGLGLGAGAAAAAIVGSGGVAAALGGAAMLGWRKFESTAFGKKMLDKVGLGGPDDKKMEKLRAGKQAELIKDILTPESISAIVSNAIRQNSSEKLRTQIRDLREQGQQVADGKEQKLDKFEKSLRGVTPEFFRSALARIKAERPELSEDQAREAAMVIAITTGRFEKGQALEDQARNDMKAKAPDKLDRFVAVFGAARSGMGGQTAAEKTGFAVASVALGVVTGAVARYSNTGRAATMGLAGGMIGYAIGKRAEAKAGARLLEEAEGMIGEAEAKLEDIDFPSEDLKSLRKDAATVMARLESGMFDDQPTLKERAENFVYQVDMLEMKNRNGMADILDMLTKNGDRVAEAQEADLSKLEALAKKGKTKKYIYAAIGAVAGAAVGYVAADAMEGIKKMWSHPQEAAPVAAGGVGHAEGHAEAPPPVHAVEKTAAPEIGKWKPEDVIGKHEGASQMFERQAALHPQEFGYRGNPHDGEAFTAWMAKAAEARAHHQPVPHITPDAAKFKVWADHESYQAVRQEGLWQIGKNGTRTDHQLVSDPAQPSHGHWSMGKDGHPHFETDATIKEVTHHVRPPEVPLNQQLDRSGTLRFETPRDAVHGVSPQTTEQYRHVFERQALSRESLEQMAHGQNSEYDRVTVQTASGKTFEVVNDPNARLAALERLQAIRNTLGNEAGGKFHYAADGSVTGFEAAHGGGNPAAILREGWEGRVAEQAGHNPLLSPLGSVEKVRDLAGQYDQLRTSYGHLLANGEGQTPEALHLLKMMEQRQGSIDNLIGGADVIREVPLDAAVDHAQGAATAVDHGVGHGVGGSVERHLSSRAGTHDAAAQHVPRGGHGATGSAEQHLKSVPKGHDVTAQHGPRVRAATGHDAAVAGTHAKGLGPQVPRGPEATINVASTVELPPQLQEAIDQVPAGKAHDALVTLASHQAELPLAVQTELAEHPKDVAVIAADWLKNPLMKNYSLEQAVLAKTLESKIGQGTVSVEALAKAARLPSVAGRMYEIPVQGHNTMLLDGSEGPAAARLALQLKGIQMQAGPGASAAEVESMMRGAPPTLAEQAQDARAQQTLSEQAAHDYATRTPLKGQVQGSVTEQGPGRTLTELRGIGSISDQEVLTSYKLNPADLADLRSHVGALDKLKRIFAEEQLLQQTQDSSAAERLAKQIAFEKRGLTLLLKGKDIFKR